MQTCLSLNGLTVPCLLYILQLLILGHIICARAFAPLLSLGMRSGLPKQWSVCSVSQERKEADSGGSGKTEGHGRQAGLGKIVAPALPTVSS